jgi:DNA-directed RNA polymerase-4 subunit 1
VTKLAATVHNPYFIDDVVHFLNQICPGCLSPREGINMKVCTFLTDLFLSSLSTTCFFLFAKVHLYHNLVIESLSDYLAILSRALLVDLMN